jgi:hypothetical protein
LVTGATYLAGVVGREEAADDELPPLDSLHLAADLLDDTDVLVPDRPRLVDRLNSAIRSEVGSANAGRGKSNDRVGGLLNLRVGPVVDANVAGRVQNCSSHVASFGVGVGEVRPS